THAGRERFEDRGQGDRAAAPDARSAAAGILDLVYAAGAGALSMGVTLAWVPCCQCGTPCVSTPTRWPLARCWRCLPTPLVPRVGLTPWRPTIARVLPGELGPIVPHDGRTVKERESAAALAAARERYRVLVSARPAERSEMPQAAVDARKGIMGAPGWRLDRMTYALAEDTERGEL